MSILEKAISYILDVEGDFSHHPYDSGGKTKYGITEETAKDFGYIGNMKDFPKDMAIDIYRLRYWKSKHIDLDQITQYSESLAIELFDMAVNMGPYRAARFLQRALNILNRNGKLYRGLIIDGYCGPVTLSALFKLKTNLDKRVVLKIVDTLQAMQYIKIAEKNPSQKTFIRGWMDKRCR